MDDGGGSLGCEGNPAMYLGYWLDNESLVICLPMLNTRM